MNALRFSIVIPCFNEAESLKKLIAEASRIGIEYNGEFILVDNGSNDGTWQILESCRAPNVRWVRTSKNLGYGGGILLGLKNSAASIVGWTHADLQTPLTDVVLAVEAIGNERSFIKGRRRNRSIFDNFFTVGMSIFETIIFRMRLTDINAQPTVFTKNFSDTWTDPPTDFSIDLYALIQARISKIEIRRVPVHFLPREYGNSSWNTGIVSRWKFIHRAISYSLKLRKQIRHVNRATSHQL
jgi:glycosyltransferase involved in cell wall biosynthesis